MRSAPGIHTTNDQNCAGRRARTAGSRQSTRRASRGQIIIMFAAALVGLVGLLGLATDLGYAFVQRRTMQNAADAGAIAGAHAISKSLPADPISVLSDVRKDS